MSDQERLEHFCDQGKKAVRATLGRDLKVIKKTQTEKLPKDKQKISDMLAHFHSKEKPAKAEAKEIRPYSAFAKPFGETVRNTIKTNQK